MFDISNQLHTKIWDRCISVTDIDLRTRKCLTLKRSGVRFLDEAE